MKILIKPTRDSFNSYPTTECLEFQQLDKEEIQVTVCGVYDAQGEYVNRIFSVSISDLKKLLNTLDE